LVAEEDGMTSPALRVVAAFLRHGETSDGAANVISGWRDVALTPAGKMQAAAAAERLLRLGLTRIISSDLRRARETAEIVARVLLVSVETDARWRERRWGEREGTARVLAADPDDAEAPPGGESLAELHARVAAALGALPPRCLVVTHAGPLRCTAALAGLSVTDVSPGQFLDMTRPPAAGDSVVELAVTALVLTPGDFVGRAAYVTAPEDLAGVGADSLALLQRCDKSLAVEAMTRAAATMNLTTALTAHLTHGRYSPRPYAVALGWPAGLPRQGETVRLRVTPPRPRPAGASWPDVPPVPVPHADHVGGKAAGLLLLRAHGFAVPAFEIIDTDTLAAWEATGDVAGAARAWAETLSPAGAGRWAVRSSADVEDSSEQPLSGTFASQLHLPADRVPAAVGEVLASARGPEARSRLTAGGLAAPPRMAVVVQHMVERPLLAGAAFVPAPDDPSTLLIEARLNATAEGLMDGRERPEVTARYWVDGSVEGVMSPGDAAASGAVAAALGQVAAGAAAIYRTTGRGDTEFAVDRAGRVWWLQARALPAAVEVVDRRGYAPAALAYYQALAFRVHEANGTPPVYFRCLSLADGRFGYSVGIRHRDRLFHEALQRDPDHLPRVTALGWEVEARMGRLVAELDRHEPERVLDELVLHGAVQLPFSIPMAGARMDRYQSEPVDGLATEGLLERFLVEVLRQLEGGRSLEELLGLLRLPLRTSTRCDVLRSLLDLVRGPAQPAETAVLAHRRYDLRDVPDLSPSGLRCVRERVLAELREYRAEAGGVERLREDLGAAEAALRRAAAERRTWLVEAERRLPEPWRARLRAWADYLQMKAETNETHARYRGDCFLWFARVGYAPAPPQYVRRFRPDNHAV
jgi:probable phosphoglycerate mutase